MHLIKLLDDVGHVESCFNPFGDVSVGARWAHGLRQTYHRLRNHVGRTRWYSYVTRLNWMLVSVCLDVVLTLTQYRCMVYHERNIGSEIVFDTIDGTPR
jgi:hypothetical protein